MKDRKKRSVLSWGVWLLRWSLAIVFVCSFTLSTLRLFFPEGHNPSLVSNRNIPAMEVISGENSAIPAISIRETVIFPDEAVVFLKYPPSTALFTTNDIECIYYFPNSSRPELRLSPASVDRRYSTHQIVRCPLHPRVTSISLAVKHNGNITPGPIYRWDSLAYEAMIDRDNSTVVFVKGLNLRSGRVYNPSRFKCFYGYDLNHPKLVLWADALSVAQEIVRCRTPRSILYTSNGTVKVSVRVVGRRNLDSIAYLKRGSTPPPPPPLPKHKMCVCTMLRNQARFLPEWIIYHDRIGVEQWFIYDNNSNDDLDRVIDSLVDSNYKISLHTWPWIKSQESGFAHCALRAKDSCEWVGFIDVDEFFHLPSNLTINDILSNHSSSNEVGEIRVSCHSFGPSGLKRAPAKGVLVGYTCRMAAPERHKSIVRPEALNSSLINVVHHFYLNNEFKYVSMNRSVVVINHYKYQVWEVFKEKFYRRVATYVSDWQQDRNVASKDRAPGLGTKAVEPVDWSSRFCEVRDTRLRDRVVETFGDRDTALLPWEYMS